MTIVVIRVVLEIRVDTGVSAHEGQANLAGGFDRTRVLSRNFTVALETGTGDGELAKVNALPAHRLLGSLPFPAAVALNGGVNITGVGSGAFIPVRAARAEGLTDPRGALELKGTDVIDGHARFRHTEETCDVLTDVIGHLHAHGVDARRGHAELKSTGLGIILPHAHVGRVLDSVDRHTVDGPTVDGFLSTAVVCERHAGDGGGDGNGHLALTGDIASHIGDAAIEVEGDLGVLIGCGVDELDTGGLDDGLSLIVLLRVGLWHVHEAAGLVHDKALAHVRVGVVLCGEPFGQLRPGDVGTGPTDVVVSFRVYLEEDRMGDGLR